MTIKEPMENNVVTISGTVYKESSFSHEVYGEGFYTFEILAQRLSDNADVLPVTVSERLIDPKKITLGSNVKVNGQLRSYNNYANKKNKLVLTIFAREILLDEPQEDKKPNEIFLNGFLCKKPVYRTTPFGREITDLLVAVNRAYNKSDYIPCIVWGRNARFAGTLQVGDQVRLWGRIQSRVYQKKTEEGVEERIAYEVSVSKIELPEKLPELEPDADRE